MNFEQVFDIGVAFALAFFVTRGAMRGFTGEIVSLLGLAASVFCGWTFAGPMSTVVLRYFPEWNPGITELACAVAIFMFVSLTFAAVAEFMRLLVKVAKLTFLDHVMGAVSGAVRVFIMLLFIYGAVSIFSPVVPSDWMKNSVAMKGVSAAWPSILRVMTDNGWIVPNDA
ncbi:MAG: CvpA family protein [Synergistaceae bacterium]|nr:CvpA family protein [Synergistaceae bacterium]